jgi:hypothetical protein
MISGLDDDVAETFMIGITSPSVLSRAEWHH